jgi:RNA polymerase sigma factor (sigma-70 family)
MASAAKTTNDELLMRLRSAGDSSEVMARLWENNQGLIRMIVHNVTGLTEREEGFEDMVQQSYFGFASAAESYDPASEVEFSTYAANRVKWSLCRYYERNGYTVRVPAYMRRRIRDCAERKRQMEAETGRAVTYAAALEAMGLSPAAVAGTLAAFQKLETVSMESTGGGDGEGLSLLDRLAAGENVEDAAISQEWHRELHEMLFKALGDLPEDSRRLIVQRYFQGVSAARLAEQIGCTRQTVFIRQQAAFQAIRAGRYGPELAEFMPNEWKRAQAERYIQMDRAKLAQLQLSDSERGLLAL